MLAQYLADVVQKGLDHVLDSGGELRIITASYMGAADVKHRIVEDAFSDSFITGFEPAWKRSVEPNNYENEHAVPC